MTTRQRIATVTGANCRIGLQVCKDLAGLGYQVVLTSPDMVKGQAAADKLRKASAITFHPLDVTSE